MIQDDKQSEFALNNTNDKKWHDQNENDVDENSSLQLRIGQTTINGANLNEHKVSEEDQLRIVIQEEETTDRRKEEER